VFVAIEMVRGDGLLGHNAVPFNAASAFSTIESPI
jgi:hypothetical protein